MKCPTCKGLTKNFGVFPPVETDCQDCNGSGKIDDGYPLRAIKGKQMKEERLKQNLSLREYCIKHGIDAITRSKQERGIIA